MNALSRSLAIPLLLTTPLAAQASESHEGESLKMVHKGVEVSPDIKLYSDFQLEASDPDLSNAFHLSRGYLGMKLKVTDWLGARITYDVTTAKDVGASGALIEDGESVAVDESSLTGSLTGRVKYAYVDLGSAPAARLRWGVGHTPWIDWVEHIEGTRFLRKVMWEQEYHYPSSDFGMSMLGHAGQHLAYHAGIYNGEGYHGVEELGLKDAIARISFRPAPASGAMGGLQLSGYFHMQLPMPNDQEIDRRLGGALTYRLAEQIKSADCAKVSGDKLALWYQVVYGQEGRPSEIANNLGMSLGARVELPAQLYVIARGDRFDHDLSHEDDEHLRVLGALGLRPHHSFHFALNYQGTLPTEGDAEHMVGLHSEFHL